MSKLVSVTKSSSLQKDYPCIVMLHGYGSNEQDLFSFAQYLPSEYAVYSLRAPFQSPFGGFAWFNLNFTEKGIEIVNPQEVIDSRNLVNDFIDHLPAEADRNSIFILGFSQGAVLSFDVLLNNSSLKGIIALSGFLADETHQGKSLDALKDKDIFIGHGSIDPVVPVGYARKTHELLTEKQVTHTFNEYPAEHTVTQEEFEDLLRWISSRADSSGS